MDNGVYRDAQQYRCQNADKSGAEADYNGLGVKHARDILLRSADSAQNADLLRTLENADIGDNTYHYARNNEAYCDKCDENIGYDIDYRSDGAHNKRNIVCVVYLILGIDCGVIILYNLRDGILCGECCNIDVDTGGRVEINIAQRAQILLIA